MHNTREKYVQQLMPFHILLIFPIRFCWLKHTIQKCFYFLPCNCLLQSFNGFVRTLVALIGGLTLLYTYISETNVYIYVSVRMILNSRENLIRRLLVYITQCFCYVTVCKQCRVVFRFFSSKKMVLNCPQLQNRCIDNARISQVSYSNLSRAGKKRFSKIG